MSVINWPHLSSAVSTATDECPTPSPADRRASTSGGRDGSISSYESAKSLSNRMRHRKPVRTKAERLRFTTTREARLHLSMVTVSKSKVEYIGPAASRVPVRMFADNRLRSKQPQITKSSTFERAPPASASRRH